MKRLLVIIALLGSASSAHAFGILAGANFFNSNTSGADTNPAFVGGLAFEGFVAPGLRLELDTLYAKNKNSGGSFEVIQVPVLARISLIPLFDLGLGVYGEYTLTDVSFTKFTMGAEGSLRLHLPLGAARLSVEGRYLFGLTNYVSGADSKSRSVQLLAGLNFGL